MNAVIIVPIPTSPETAPAQLIGYMLGFAVCLLWFTGWAILHWREVRPAGLVLAALSGMVGLGLVGLGGAFFAQMVTT
jgi:hypothetical protein